MKKFISIGNVGIDMTTRGAGDDTEQIAVGQADMTITLDPHSTAAGIR